MNREIKFRVWTGSTMEYEVVVGIEGAFFATVDENDSVCLSSTTKYHFNNPVMQYTGLEDKNNEPIYEGDILQSTITNTFYQVKHGWYRQYEELELENGKIHTFNYAHVGFFVEYNKNGEVCEGTLAIRNSNSVVVGNIFQHSYLLK